MCFNVYFALYFVFIQEVISEDLRATLNAFLYRTGEQSNKWVFNKRICPINMINAQPNESEAMMITLNLYVHVSKI